MNSTEELLKTLPRGYEYNFSPEEVKPSFTHAYREFRIQLTSVDSVQEWMNKYSSINNMVWRSKRQRIVTGQRILFKLDLRCQHNTDKRTRTTGKRISKNTNCPALMKVTLHRNVKLTRTQKRNPLNKDWPCYIELIDEHNHSLTNGVALRFQGISEVTKNKIIELFKQGHTPTTAIRYLKAELALESNISEEYATVTEDSRLIPTLSVCSHLYDAEIKQQSRNSAVNDIEKVIEAYCANCNGRAILGKIGKQTYVTLCSPIMQRAHILQQSSELVLVDASGGKGRQKHRVYFFITPTPVGGIPLGIIITDSQDNEIFSKALEDLKKCFPEESFYGNISPNVFLMDNNLKQCELMKSQFPESELLLCQYQVLKDLWVWLCNAKNQIEKTDRQDLYLIFKNLLNANTEASLIKSYNRAQEQLIVLKYSNYIVYLEQKWETKNLWSSCFRKTMPMTCNKTISYIEIVFRALKECIIERVSTFKLTQLFNFIVTKYEDYLERCFVDFCHDRLPKNLIRRLLPSNNDRIRIENISPHPLLEGCYIVNDETETNTKFIVDIENSFCTCDSANTGNICSHIASVMTEYSSLQDVIVTVNPEFKELLFEVATGFKPSCGWFDQISTKIKLEREETNNELNVAVESLQENHIEQNIKTDEDEVENQNIKTDEDEVENQNIKTEEDEVGNQNIKLDEDEVENIVNEVKKITHKMETFIRTNPAMFLSAGKEMIKNAKAITSENDLLSAMRSFGKSTHQQETYPNGIRTGSPSHKRKNTQNLEDCILETVLRPRLKKKKD